MIQISFQLFVILISTDVLREIPRDVAENFRKRDLLGSKGNQVVPQLRGRCFNHGGEPRRSYRDSVLLFLAQFLETGIGAQRVPDWVEPKKGWRNSARKK
jgi:hypothetical protein